MLITTLSTIYKQVSHRRVNKKMRKHEMEVTYNPQIIHNRELDREEIFSLKSYIYCRGFCAAQDSTQIITVLDF